VIRAFLGQRKIRPSRFYAKNAHLGNDWGHIPLQAGIRAFLGQSKFRQSPGQAQTALSGPDWGKIPLLSGMSFWNFDNIKSFILL